MFLICLYFSIIGCLAYPINITQGTELIIKQEYDLQVEYKERVGDKGWATRIFAFDDINNSSKLSRRIQFNEPLVSQSHTLPEVRFESDTFTGKNNDAYIKRDGTDESDEKFTMPFKILHMGSNDGDPLFFAITHEVEEFLSVFIIKATTRHENTTAFPFPNHGHRLDLSENVAVLLVSMASRSTNKRDIENIRIEFWNDDHVVPVKVEVFSGIDPENPTKPVMGLQRVYFQSPALYMDGKSIGIKVHYNRTNITIDHKGLKVVKILCFLRYSVSNSLTTKEQTTKIVDSFVATNKNHKGMNIIVREESYCAGRKFGTVTFSSKDCHTFFLSQHNIIGETGEYISYRYYANRNNPSLIYTPDGTKKRLNWKKGMITFYGETFQRFFDSDVIRGSTVSEDLIVDDPLIFQYSAKYKMTFDTSPVEKGKHWSDEVNKQNGTISILKLDDKTFIKCIFERGHNECIQSKKLGDEFHTLKAFKDPVKDFILVGFDNRTQTTYWRHQVTGNYAYLTTTNELFIVDSKRWNIINKFVSFVKVFTVQRSNVRDDTLKEVEDASEISVNYMASWHREFSLMYVWPSSVDCQFYVAKTSHSFLRNCQEIKKYCNSVKSGIYYIGIQDGPLGRVYCDMETDKDAWMLISRSTIPGSTHLDGNDFPTMENLYQVVDSNYGNHLSSSKTSLDNVLTFLKVGYRIRFYCTSTFHGRTVHIKTYPSHHSKYLFEYFKAMRGIQRTPAKYTFSRYPDDNSKMMTKPELLGYQQFKDTLGNPYAGANQKLYVLIMTEGQYYFDSRYYHCDDKFKRDGNATWEIYMV